MALQAHLRSICLHRLNECGGMHVLGVQACQRMPVPALGRVSSQARKHDAAPPAAAVLRRRRPSRRPTHTWSASAAEAKHAADAVKDLLPPARLCDNHHVVVPIGVSVGDSSLRWGGARVWALEAQGMQAGGGKAATWHGQRSAAPTCFRVTTVLPLSGSSKRSSTREYTPSPQLLRAQGRRSG